METNSSMREGGYVSFSYLKHMKTPEKFLNEFINSVTTNNQTIYPTQNEKNDNSYKSINSFPSQSTNPLEDALAQSKSAPWNNINLGQSLQGFPIIFYYYRKERNNKTVICFECTNRRFFSINESKKVHELLQKIRNLWNVDDIEIFRNSIPEDPNTSLDEIAFSECILKISNFYYQLLPKKY